MVLVFHAGFWAVPGPEYIDFQCNPAASWMRTIIESACLVCVNVFVMISGWFGIKTSIKGLCNFIFQCLFFVLGIYLFAVLSGYDNFSLGSFAKAILLIKCNWFIRAYLALFLISPILNIFAEHSSKRLFRFTLIAFFIFQTIYGYTHATLFIGDGYTAWSFIGLYLLARYLKKYQHEIGVRICGGG